MGMVLKWVYLGWWRGVGDLLTYTAAPPAILQICGLHTGPAWEVSCTGGRTRTLPTEGACVVGMV